MSLKLFRSTEFAESSLFVPYKQRVSTHPAWVCALASLWLATICNVPLWRELLKICEQGQINAAWPVVRLGGLIASACFVFFCIFSSRRLLKPLITLLLVLSALASHLMFNLNMMIDATLINRLLHPSPLFAQNFMSMPFLVALFVLAIAPAIWLWRTPVRRLSPMHYLLQNWGLAAASCTIILVIVLASTPDLLALVRAQPQLRQMANPFGPLQAIFDVAKLRFSPS